jgi:hypothetical protein
MDRIECRVQGWMSRSDCGFLLRTLGCVSKRQVQVRGAQLAKEAKLGQPLSWDPKREGRAPRALLVSAIINLGDPQPRRDPIFSRFTDEKTLRVTLSR